MPNTTPSTAQQPLSVDLTFDYQKRTIRGEVQYMIDSRELHKKLEVKSDHRKWIRRQVERATLLEGTHFLVEEDPVIPYRRENTGSIALVYQLTFSAVKHICLMDKGPRGREIREYFIAIEEAWREQGYTRKADGAPIGHGVRPGDGDLDLQEVLELLPRLASEAEAAAMLMRTKEREFIEAKAEYDTSKYVYTKAYEKLSKLFKKPDELFRELERREVSRAFPQIRELAAEGPQRPDSDSDSESLG